MLYEVDGKISGNISSVIPTLSGNISIAVPIVQGGISSALEVIEGSITSIDDIDVYDGAYVVTPLNIDQELDTRQDLMRDNLVVKEVPYAEVENPSGGKTITIGG